MTCDEVREAFSEFYDDMLFGARLTDVTLHLDECSDCRAEWAAFSMTLQVVSRLGTADPSPEFAARVRRQIESPPWWRQLARRLFVPPHVKVPIHAVALAVLSFAGLMLFQRSPELRREAEVAVVRPPTVARQVPPVGSLAPAPPTLEKEKAAPTEKVVPVPKAPPKTSRVDEGAAPPATSAPSSSLPAPLEKKGRALPLHQEQAAQPRAAPVPKSSETAAGSSAASKATEEDLRPPGARLQQSAPIPAESQGIARSPGPVKSLAPSGADRLPPIPPGSADELFSAAVTEFAQQDYDLAIERFTAFIAAYPRDTRTPDARFYLGEAQFARQRYAAAVPEFEALIRQFPESRRVPAALYRQGQARLALGDQTGCQRLRDVITRYSQTREAASAREVLSSRCP
jgi:tol-pal system protein YbgF